MRDEVGKIDDDGSNDRGGERGRLAHPIHDDVADRVGARVTQRFGDQQQHRAESNQRTDGIERAVHAVEGGQPGEAEEGRGRAPVARKRKSVLSCRQALSGGVEVDGRARASRRPCGNAEADEEDGRKHRDGDEIHRALPLARALSTTTLTRGSWRLAEMRA